MKRISSAETRPEGLELAVYVARKDEGFDRPSPIAP